MGHVHRSLVIAAAMAGLLLPGIAVAQAKGKPADKAAPAAAAKTAPAAADKAAPAATDKPAEKAAPKPVIYTIGKIVFQGETPYSQDALEAAAGLKPGATLNSSGLQAAAERLINSGAFGEVNATIDGPVKSIDVIFKVQPVEKQHVLRASFDNFVWFSREELNAGVQQRVPLFNGTVPEGGTIQDAVQTALQEMLAAKGVKATVTSDLLAPHPGQPYRFAEYRVTSPEVKVRTVDVAIVPPAFAATTNAVIRSAIGSDYNDGLRDGISERVLADYKNSGYLDAKLTGMTTTIASSTPAKVEVDVKAKLEPGEAYKLAKLEWAGSPVMSTQEFNAAAKIHSGDIASQEAVRASVENLDAVYRDHGYMDVVLDAVPTLTPANHQVSYAVLATPGPQYKLRELKVLNLTPEQRKDFDHTWKLKPGDIYNADYVTSFLRNNTELGALRGYTASYRVTEEPDSDVLDLEIVFRKAGAAK